MKEQLIAILETFGYPVLLQGSFEPDEAYPDSFFTFWNFDTPEDAFYSNDANAAVWGFWVYFYSIDPAAVEDIPEQARLALKSAGWTLDGRAHDISVERPTHTGAFFTALFYDKYTETED